MKLIDQFPGLYSTFFDSFFDNSVPDESLATCSDCAMCKKEGEPEFPGRNYFSTKTKCCTYHPFLPNYLVGGILSDQTPEMQQGKKRIQLKIKNRVGVTPQGISPSKNYSRLFKNKGDSFGKNEELLCPYYEKVSGNCTVWHYRASLCSTWFCKNIAGVDGKLFWETLKEYLYIAQDEIRDYTLLKMGQDTQVDEDRVMELLSGELDLDSMSAMDLDKLSKSDEYYNTLWGEWEGSEETYYKKCFEIAKNLNPDKFKQLMGDEGAANLGKLKKFREEIIRPNLPEFLIKNSKLKAHKIDGQSFALLSTNVYMKVSIQVYEILEYFSGDKTNKEIIELVGNQHGLFLHENLLVSLYQNRILVESKSIK